MRSLMLCLAIIAVGCSDAAGPLLPGDELAYRSLVANGLFVMKADGSDRRLIWSSFGDGAMCDSWSPDGSAIAFHLFNADQIVKVTVAGGRADTLTAGPNGNECPMWSPDGRRIAFIKIVRDSVTSGFQLYVMNADGSNPSRLGTGSFVADRGSWSPDGKRIALTSFADKIVLVNAATGEVGPPLVGGRAPSWSPDGSRIVFDAQVGGVMQIYAMNADGTNVQRLTVDDSLGFNNQYPVWTPNGKLISFHRYQLIQDPALPPSAGPRLVASLHLVHLDGTPLRWPVGDSAGGDLIVWRPRH